MKAASSSLTFATTALHAQEADLAQKLANPISDLISLPIQSNIDFGVGPGDGTIRRTNIKPVIPFNISEDWSVILRTILPVVDQEGLVAAGAGLDASGLGDITQSFFFRRRKAPRSGVSASWRSCSSRTARGRMAAAEDAVKLKFPSKHKQIQSYENKNNKRHRIFASHRLASCLRGQHHAIDRRRFGDHRTD
jgi:hypothetical protein